MKTVTRGSVELLSSVDDASYFIELQFVPRDPCKREVTDMGFISSNMVGSSELFLITVLQYLCA